MAIKRSSYLCSEGRDKASASSRERKCIMKYNDLSLGTIEAVFNKLGGMEGAQRFLRGELAVETARALLRQIAVAEIGGTQRFVAKDHLAEANVGWTSENFNRLFLELVEENGEGATLYVHCLERASLDASILAELGDRAKISLAHFFGALKKQSKGEPGPLLTNGYANIAYLTGSDGNLWAVDAYWDGVGRYWVVNAYSVGNPSEWDAGSHVLSR